MTPPSGKVYPRVLPNLPVVPHQYATESAPVYAQRVYRWRQWLDHDLNRALLGGPMQWFATTDEIKNYEAWRDQPEPGLTSRPANG